MLDYQVWIDVGMALEQEGHTANDWDNWSQKDSRYRPGECYQKWDTFQDSTKLVIGGTINQLALDQGYKPVSLFDDGRGELDWNSTINYDNN